MPESAPSPPENADDTVALGKTLKILVADDHAIVRTGVSTFLQHRLQCPPCLEASDGHAAAALAGREHPHIALLDVELPSLNGLDLIQQIRRVSPETEIAVLTGYLSPEFIRPAFEGGAKSFILKTESSTYLAEAVLHLARHRYFITPHVHEILYGNSVSPAADIQERLSPRERELLQLLAEGRSNKEAASQLGISIKTIETHRAAIMRKMNFKSLSDLVRYAIRHQIIVP